jgi:hypothetical protein
MIDRSAAVDGRTRWAFYYMNNIADPIRNLRACGNFQQGCGGPTPIYDTAVAAITSRGGAAAVLPGCCRRGTRTPLG